MNNTELINILDASTYENDELFNIIKSNFNNTDNIELLMLNYKIYTIYKNNMDDLFIVNFDDIYPWIGYTRKNHAKTLLIKNFILGSDYTEMCYNDKKLAAGLEAASFTNENKHGGHNKKLILLTITCFKKFCMKACTSEADKIFDYYSKIEKIIFDYIEIKQQQLIENNKKILEETTIKLQLKDQEKEQLLQQKEHETEQLLQQKEHETEQLLKQKEQILQLKDQELETNKKLLDLKNQELETLKNQTYKEIQKENYIYIFTSDIPNHYKCGMSKDIKTRKKQLQTGNVKEIEVLYTFLTSDEKLLETIIHSILQQYRINREYFNCNLNYMKSVINIAGTMLDTLKSTFHNISYEEILHKLNDKLQTNNPINKSILSSSLSNLENTNMINESNSTNVSLNLENTNIINESNSTSVSLNFENTNIINESTTSVTLNLENTNIINESTTSVSLNLENTNIINESTTSVSLNLENTNIINESSTSVSINLENNNIINESSTSVSLNSLINDELILLWFKETFICTEEKTDILQLKDIHKIFTKNFIYRKFTKKQRLKYNKSYFVDYIETNIFFDRYYYSRYNNKRSVIICWKLKETQ